MSKSQDSRRFSRPLKWLYIITLAVLFFSGFGQMPIFNRYYVTSIPGLSWSGDFYLNVVIHYLAVALLLGLLVYYLVYQALNRALWPPRGGPGWIRSIILLLMFLSGLVLVARNLSWVVLQAPLIQTAALVHIFGAILFLILAATYFRLARAGK